MLHFFFFLNESFPFMVIQTSRISWRDHPEGRVHYEMTEKIQFEFERQVLMTNPVQSHKEGA